RRDLPLPGQLEVPECVDGHEIAAVQRPPVGDPGDVAVRDLLDRAVHDRPVTRRNGVVAQAAPAGEGPTVEEQAPAGGSLGGGETVGDGGWGRGGACPGLEQSEDEDFSEHETSLDVNSDRVHVGDYI